MRPIGVAHRFFVPFSLFFRESEFLREADKAAVRARREENGGMGKNAGESLKGECWRIERGTMRGDEERKRESWRGEREIE